MTTCHSTNEEAADRVRNGQLPDGTLIITDNQTRGRGQQSNRWWSEPGKNLTFSLVFYPSDLRVDEQFLLNAIASLGITDVLMRLFPDVRIKWPNDIYVKDQKMAGILIQNILSGNRLRTSIIGIGLNVNQLDFPIPVATSIKEQTGKEHDLENLLEDVCKQLEVRYMQLRAGNRETLMQEYKERLYQWGIRCKYRSDKEFEGEIADVLTSGELVMNTDEGRKLFRFKEIQFL